LVSGTAYENDAAAFCVYKGRGSSVNLTGLTPETNYYFLVYNVQTGPTSYGASATFNTASLAIPADVTGLTGTTGYTSATLTWTLPAWL
jgi:hypothetical protein